MANSPRRLPAASPINPSGSPAPQPAPRSSSSATPPTPSSPASAPSSPTIPPSPIAPASLAAAALLRVILDTHLRIPLDSQLVHGVENDILILCGTSADHDRAIALRKRDIQVETLPDHAGRLSLPAALAALAERNILSLLLECGSHLNGSFLRQNLVDKATLIYSETELGDQAIPFAQGIPSPYLFEHSLSRITRTTLGTDAFVTGYLHDPWPQPSAPDML